MRGKERGVRSKILSALTPRAELMETEEFQANERLNVLGIRFLQISQRPRRIYENAGKSTCRFKPDYLVVGLVDWNSVSREKIYEIILACNPSLLVNPFHVSLYRGC